MIYQHEARGADQAITSAIDSPRQAINAAMRTTMARRARLPPWANGPLMAQKINNRLEEGTGRARDTPAELDEPSWSG